VHALQVLRSCLYKSVTKGPRLQRRMDRLLVYKDNRHDFDERYMFPLALPPRPMRSSKHRWSLPEGFEPINGEAFYAMWKGSDPDWASKIKALAAKRRAESAKAPAVQPGHTQLLQGLRVQ
jgi:hypothetical protein